MSEHRRGLVYGVAAYGVWGLFPLYWPLLAPAGAIEVLAHRICWSVLTMVLLTVLLRRTTQLRAILRDGRAARLLALAGVLVAVNWGGFIYGVQVGRVVEVSLGYFINPLVTLALGVLVLGEQLRRAQWAALSIALLAVLVLTIDYGRPPWIALLLAASFAAYALTKKRANVGAVESLTYETAVVAPVALGFLVYLHLSGAGTFGNAGLANAALLMTTGLVTAVPLICFGAAANRIPLATVGLLQYLTPTLQFALGILVFREEMTTVRWVGFGLVWLSLVLFTYETLRHRRHVRLMAASATC